MSICQGERGWGVVGEEAFQRQGVLFMSLATKSFIRFKDFEYKTELFIEMKRGVLWH